MNKAELEIPKEDSLAWLWCWIGIHWCTRWSDPNEDEERRYQSRRCVHCGKVWERRIPVR